MTSKLPQAGPYALSRRQMNDGERKALVGSIKPIRYNAIAMSILAIATAIMVNYAYDVIVLLVPLMFAAACIGLASQYRKSLKAASKMLSENAVPELRGVPTRKSMGRGWLLGPVTVVSSRELSKVMPEGVPATVTFFPERRVALSVNGVPLKKAVQITAPPGFGQGVGAHVPPATPAAHHAPPQAKVQGPPPPDEDLPPPPDDWAETRCAKCGRVLPVGSSFCSSCGAKVTR